MMVYKSPRSAAALLVTLIVAISWQHAYADMAEGRAAFDRGDYSTAVQEFLEDANRGVAVAQYSVGAMYYYGTGVPQDYTEAFKWLALAAAHGYSEAQVLIGNIYDHGRGVPQNRVEAVRWYHLAANQGDPFAQSLLGLAYALGQGVPQDYVEAHKWSNLATARHTDNAARESAASVRESVAGEMTAEQIVEAQKLAREWRPQNQ
jgi:TPR repeat protein